MHKIRLLATQFRKAIETAIETEEIKNDICFRNFPLGCCGDTSDLLAQFLLDNGISTIYVNGNFYDESDEDKYSHAWLKTCDEIIIDITGDQFKYNPLLLKNNRTVFVGQPDSFYELFDVDERRDIHVFHGIQYLGEGCQPRLLRLYAIICQYV